MARALCPFGGGGGVSAAPGEVEGEDEAKVDDVAAHGLADDIAHDYREQRGSERQEGAHQVEPEMLRSGGRGCQRHPLRLSPGRNGPARGHTCHTEAANSA